MGGRKPGSASSTPTAAASSSSSSGSSSTSKTSPSQSPNVSSTTSLASSKVFSNCSASSSSTADQSFIEANSRFTDDCNFLFIIACWSRSEVGKKLDRTFRTFIPGVSTKPSILSSPNRQIRFLKLPCYDAIRQTRRPRPQRAESQTKTYSASSNF